MEAPNRYSQMAVIELANTFLSAMRTHRGREQDAARVAILTASALVAERAGPHCWTAFDAEAYFAEHDQLPHEARISAAFVLAGFFGWLAFIGLLEPQRADTIVADIERHGPGSPLLRVFCEGARREMASLADLLRG